MTKSKPDPGNSPPNEWVGKKVDLDEIKPLMRAAQRGDFDASDEEGDNGEQRTTGDTPTQ